MSTQSADSLLASDAEREAAVALLRAGSADGRLTVEELEERTAQALAARTHAELEPLTADLPRPPREATSRRSGSRSRRIPRDQLVAYVAVNVLLIAVWAVTGAGYFWPIWPLLGWGIGLATSGAPLCGRRRPHRSSTIARV